jgi:hypothetical protein
MYEHGEPFEGFLMVDLTSEEDDAVPDTSRDEQIARKLFGDLNRCLLEPPGDSNVILSNSEEGEEVHEDDHTNTEAAPSFVANSPAPTASIASNDETSDEVQVDSSGGGDNIGMH